MSLLFDVVAVLRAEAVPHAIIGAAAMSAHGVSRATADVDLLISDRRYLAPESWATLAVTSTVDDGIPIVSMADLILLKLYAGGPQDAWDIRQILDLPGQDLRPVVEDRLAALPRDATTLWHTITSADR